MIAVPFLLAAFLAAQNQPPAMASLSGTVVNAANGAPLGKVQLRAEPAGAKLGSTVASTTTDAKGNFSMVDLAPGDYRLAGIRNGYLDTYYGARHAKGAGTIIKLNAGEELKGLQLKMTPFSVIAGTVRDADGEPVSGASIRLYEQIYQYGRPKVEAYHYNDDPLDIKTDDLGQYRIANLEPGKYYVQAVTRQERLDGQEQIRSVDHSVKSDTPPTVVLPTLYPGVTDPALARVVDVGPGAQATGTDIALVRSPVCRVTVIATAPPGSTVGSLSLISNPEMPRLSLTYFGVRNQQGDFVFDAVPPGEYTMEASGGAAGHEFLARLTALRVNHDYTTRITVTQPLSYLAARVRVEGKPDQKPPQLGMAVVGDSEGRQAWGTNTDGILPLAPDRYNIYLEDLPAPLVVKSMRAGDTDVFHDGLTVGEEGGQILLDILLAPEGGKVDGTVLDADGKSAPGATVLLVTADQKLRARFDSFHPATADQSGRFHLDNVRPGEYKVFAWDDVEPDAWFDPEFLKKFEDRGAAVNLPASGHVSVEIHRM